MIEMMEINFRMAAQIIFTLVVIFIVFSIFLGIMGIDIPVISKLMGFLQTGE